MGPILRITHTIGVALLLLVCSACFVTASPNTDSSFRNAQKDYAWSFPRDHGAHPSYRTEWWYFTGIVQAGERTFGYQFTIFRQRTKGKPRPSSEWFTNQVFMAHLAISDLRNRDHRAAHRMARGHPRLAKADRDMPGSIEVRGWSLHVGEPWRIEANHRDLTLSLALRPTTSPLFQGPGGYSRKGSDPGQASMYYSQTRMKTTGQLRINDQSHSVNGTSWFDHEFGSSQLGNDQEGWDWISLRLSDGSDLMIYRLRKTDGGITPQSSATLRRPDGSVEYLRADSWSMEPVAWWRSPETDARYPVRWSVQIDDPEVQLTVDRRFDAQEMVLEHGMTAPYWEGVIQAKGSIGGESVTGEGYLELTGYAVPLSGSF